MVNIDLSILYFLCIFDLLLFTLGLYINTKIQLEKITTWISIPVILLLYGLVIPYISIKLQIEYHIYFDGLVRDGTNFLWLMFKIPLFWVIGLMQIGYIYYQKFKPNEDEIRMEKKRKNYLST